MESWGSSEISPGGVGTRGQVYIPAPDSSSHVIAHQPLDRARADLSPWPHHCVSVCLNLLQAWANDIFNLSKFAFHYCKDRTLSVPENWIHLLAYITGQISKGKTNHKMHLVLLHTCTQHMQSTFNIGALTSESTYLLTKWPSDQQDNGGLFNYEKGALLASPVLGVCHWK